LSKEIDPESQKLWDEFRKTEKNWCCKLMCEIIQSGYPFLQVFSPKGEINMVRLYYCPRCGRKL
jgi:hypothetical protein